MTGGLPFTMGINRTTAKRGASGVVSHMSAAIPSANEQSGNGAAISTQVMPDYILVCPDKLRNDCDGHVRGT